MRIIVLVLPCLGCSFHTDKTQSVDEVGNARGAANRMQLKLEHVLLKAQDARSKLQLLRLVAMLLMDHPTSAAFIPSYPVLSSPAKGRSLKGSSPAVWMAAVLETRRKSPLTLRYRHNEKKLDRVLRRVCSHKHKWLGGAVAADGSIYGIPSHAESVIKIVPQTGSVSLLPRSSFLSCEPFKWLRGVVVPEDEGAIYGIPAAAGTVLRISPTDGKVSTVGSFPGAPWSWHGAQLAPDGMIYAIPSCAEQVLKVNPITKEVSMIGPKMEGRTKFYGGIVGDDGCVYGIPCRADGVLKIDPKTQEVSKLGNLDWGFVESWHGGAKSPINGNIYGFPANADSVLCIIPETGEVKKLRPDDTSAMQGKYKWLGGTVSRDGNIYCVPSDATKVLKIEPATNRVTTFGNVQGGIGNKWQGGVLGPPGDDKIYCIPSDADTVLVIDPTNDDALSYLGEGQIPKGIKDKWQGGFLVGDTIYAIPENADTLLKLHTPTQKIELVPLQDVLHFDE
mmetsp:Transcript_130567/g.244284  ORF Transcript_130567/g.244284 Transcript_130567/m.244284 type:complete len:505 (-) Transcript_130567:58-1572(-)